MNMEIAKLQIIVHVKLVGKAQFVISAYPYQVHSFNLDGFIEEYIFPRPRKVSPRDGTEVKTCFIFRGCREEGQLSIRVWQLSN